jgi:deoxyadenosine/deoxycytidine kinase
VCIEGPIGAGKSHFIAALKAYANNHQPHWRFLQEPVKQWLDLGLLQAYYANQTKYGYAFQVTVMQDRLRWFYDCVHGDAVPEVVFFERSMQADRTIFARSLHERGHMTPLEWDLYQYNWDRGYSVMGPPIELFLYCHCSEQTCWQRIQQRSRDGEQRLTRDIASDNHRRYNDVFKPDDQGDVMPWQMAPRRVLDTTESWSDERLEEVLSALL